MTARTIQLGDQVWDLDSAAFKEECRRQCLLVAAADAADQDLQDWLDAAWADLWSMIEEEEREALGRSSSSPL